MKFYTLSIVNEDSNFTLIQPTCMSDFLDKFSEIFANAGSGFLNCSVYVLDEPCNEFLDKEVKNG